MIAFGAVACGDEAGKLQEPQIWEWSLPSHAPAPVVPADNLMTVAKVSLGRMIFYDPALSTNAQQSCASCHEQARGFAEPRPVSEGSTGEFHPRNAQGLANVAYVSTLTWANPFLTNLELQIQIPIFGENPIELGVLNSSDQELVLDRFRNNSDYIEAFQAAFPDVNEPINMSSITDALASFLRSLTSFDAPYDRYLEGDLAALSPEALRGMELFFSERLECFHCHGGFLFSGASVHEGQSLPDQPFFNTGLYNLDEQGAYPAPNLGLMEITEDPNHMGMFRPPSLRNVAVTAPYGHDGSVPTLEDVIMNYARGGRLIEDGPFRGDGAENPNKSGFIIGFELSDQELQDLITFLSSLTDQTFLNNPQHADPGVRAEP